MKQCWKSVTLDQLNYPCLNALNLIWKPNVSCFNSRWSPAKCLYHPSAEHLCSRSAYALVRQWIILHWVMHCPSQLWALTPEPTVHDWSNDWTCHWMLILHHDENIKPLQPGSVQWWPDIVVHASIKKKKRAVISVASVMLWHYAWPLGEPSKVLLAFWTWQPIIRNKPQALSLQRTLRSFAQKWSDMSWVDECSSGGCAWNIRGALHLAVNTKNGTSMAHAYGSDWSQLLIEEHINSCQNKQKT